jgi:hypothetical protein
VRKRDACSGDVGRGYVALCGRPSACGGLSADKTRVSGFRIHGSTLALERRIGSRGSGSVPSLRARQLTL